MSRYVILSGFLGAGKTTTMAALADCVKSFGGRAAILVNDLGTDGLVDLVHTSAPERIAEEISGGCICYQTENLVDRLRRFRDIENADIIFSDIPGCGIGALDHVYHKLTRDYNGEFTLCPFTAVADPDRLRAIMPEQANINLPDEMRFLFDAQLKEAELIVLNKIDSISKHEQDRLEAFIRKTYPHAELLSVSARLGIGIKELLTYLMSHESNLPERDIGYGSEAFYAAEEKLSWYDCKAWLRGSTFQPNDFVSVLAESIRHLLIQEKRNVPHLKIWADTDRGESIKCSLLGVDYPLEFDRKADGVSEDLKIIVNARAACEPKKLAQIMDMSFAESAKRFSVEHEQISVRCFGMVE